MTVPSRACASCTGSRLENGTALGEPRAQRGRQVRHLLVAGRAARRPAPHLAGAEGGLAGVGERLVEQRRGPRRLWWQRRAARQVPRPCRRRLAARVRAARVRRPRHASAARSCATRRATSTAACRSPSTAGRCASRTASAPSTRVHKPRGVVSTARDPQGRPTIVSLVPSAAPPVPGRPPRRRHDRADPAHRRRRARAPAHAPVVRGPAHLPRQGPPPAGARGRAASACARGSSSRTAGPRPRASSGSRADRLEITIHEGRKRQVRRMCEAVGHPVIALERVRFGPLWLGKLEEGQHRRLTARRGRAAPRRAGR